MQTTSDITGFDQIVREKTVGASYGDAFLAALAVGMVKPSKISVWNPTARTVRSENDAALEHNYEIFKHLYTVTKDLMKLL